MILVRMVFQAKMGHAGRAVEDFKRSGEVARAAGGTAARRVRVLTDLSGPFDTVIQELEFDSVDAYLKNQATMFADPRWQEMTRSGGFGEGLIGGSKEFYTIEFEQ